MRKGGIDVRHDVDWNALKEAALAARQQAYVPYSSFAVGAALLDEKGTIFTGCNVENASYGLTNCAERTAVFSMATKGSRAIVAIAVVADSPTAISPCGACRQVMAEFSQADTPVLLFNLSDETMHTTVGDLLPYGFSQHDLTHSS